MGDEGSAQTAVGLALASLPRTLVSERRGCSGGADGGETGTRVCSSPSGAPGQWRHLSVCDYSSTLPVCGYPKLSGQAEGGTLQ